jgi:calcineurin-like phosphoesterase family protein
MIFYTSDLHFCDEKILRVCNRPFDSVDAMNQALILKWNGRINGTDTVYILGDIFPCAGGDEIIVINLLKKLNGEKILILGNHDEEYAQALENSKLFESIKHMAFVTDTYKEIVLCHYPLISWRNDENGAIHLYGHIHNKDLPDVREYYKNKKAYNVGLDVRGFVPITLREILGDGE